MEDELVGDEDKLDFDPENVVVENGASIPSISLSLPKNPCIVDLAMAAYRGGETAREIYWLNSPL